MGKNMEVLRECAEKLWQGQGVNMESLLDAINQVTDELMEGASQLSDYGIVFPLEYVNDAMLHLGKSVEAKDDYLLADCLYYEWLEIVQVYQEVWSEVKYGK